MKYWLCMAVTACALGVHPAMAQEKKTEVVLDTSAGKIKIELYPDKAPITVKNFLSYVEDKHFDNTIFHRVIPNFMIQGGGIDVSMTEKRGKDPIKNESTNGLENKRGAIAMARTGDPNSATAQFFINLKDNGFLNKAEARDGVGYCVFGKVVDGMDVVDKIAQARTGIRTITDRRGIKSGNENVPLENVVLKSVEVVKPDEAK
jgi:cyclophilin family peptidyl-prolyl cis-trans isomerase